VEKKQKKTKGNFAAAVLTILLSIGMIIFAGTPVYAADNTAVSLNLNSKSNINNVSFEAENMFPGDSVSNIYRIEVSGLKKSEQATIYFQAVIREEYEKLAEVLQCEVVLADTGEVLYSGLMRNMSTSAVGVLYAPKADYLDYEISVWLDTKAGNEYQGKTLIADFNWWIEQAGQRVEIASLTEVPEGLQNTAFCTIEKIKNELSRILISKGGSAYSIDNMAFYDVRLQFWNGREWIDVTVDDFPIDGINVTLPYPEGTTRDTHDFMVSHMFTVDSERLGIKAGEVEWPPVTKASDGLKVTFKGLSPVAIAWKELKAEDNVTTTFPEDEPTADNTSINDVFTGDTVPIMTYIYLMLSTFGGVFYMISVIKKCKEYEDE